MNRNYMILALMCLIVPLAANAQSYPNGLIDKTIAVVGGEMISISDVEGEIQMMRAQGMQSDQNMRCELLEGILQSKLFLTQARLDSLKVNEDVVASEMNQRLDQIRTQLGGDEAVEEYFNKPLYKLRQEWRQALQDQSLQQQEQQKIVEGVPPVTPFDVQQYIAATDPEDLPIVPAKYQLSQICIYPDREAAKMAVKEKLLEIRERIMKGERFSTLARLYSQDPGSARRGGELGMASRSIFWPAFSDAAMALKPGVVSQIVETPDGFHIIEVLEKKGDMFNVRHILLKPEYTIKDREKGFERLDSLKTQIDEGTLTFSQAARFFSEDPATRTNNGQMSDPNTGSAYFEIDQLKPQDYNAIRDLEIGGMSEPIESLDNEGRSGNTVYKILRLDKIIPAHVATFEHDYNELMGQARQQKEKKAIDEFISSKIQTTFIIIDPLFKDCNFENPHWAEHFRK